MDLGASLISTVYGRHPARALSFDELCAGMMAAVHAQNVVVSREEGLEQYMYTNGCRFENRWDLFSLLARGLIVDPIARRVVATPFPKFFNFGEFIPALPDEPFEVTEKIDGSLGIVFHHRSRWQVATKGRLTSEQAIWATSRLNEQCATAHLIPGTTYLVEIVYPQNRIVIPYDFEALFLLGGYDEQGHELPRKTLGDVAAATGLRPVPVHSHQSLDELLSVARELPRHREGFVVRFQSGLRIKIKGEQYVRIHRLLSNCTPLALWEGMMNAEDMDKIRLELPEETLRDFDTIRRLLNERLSGLVAEVKVAVERSADLPDKTIGLMIQDAKNELTPTQRKFLFMARKGRFIEHVNASGEARRKAFMTFRPDRNQLAGYEPSDAINRFWSEDA